MPSGRRIQLPSTSLADLSYAKRRPTLSGGAVDRRVGGKESCVRRVQLRSIRRLLLAGVPVPSIPEAEPVPVPKRSVDRAVGQCSMNDAFAALLGRMREMRTHCKHRRCLQQPGR